MENKKARGFTTIELIIVVAIIGNLAAIAVPRLSGYSKSAMQKVCESNWKTVEGLHAAFLSENHGLVSNFDVVCPSGGLISYKDGQVKCSVHLDYGVPEDLEDSSGEEVPWLWLDGRGDVSMVKG